MKINIDTAAQSIINVCRSKLSQKEELKNRYFYEEIMTLVKKEFIAYENAST